ncbi:MAG: hypothetical protein ACREP8_10115, partial [Candidatus Binatia bacterium]
SHTVSRQQESLGGSDESTLSTVRLAKVLLVSSDAFHEVEKCLLTAGCWVTKVTDGETALAQAERDIFDVAVIVSTGESMDLAETVFNLRDINDSMQILLVDQDDGDPNAIAKEIMAQAAPNTKLLSLNELENYFGSADREKTLGAKTRVKKRRW